METRITNLPGELVEDILYRVPLKSMRGVRLTCKNWNTLSESSRFKKKHICKEEEVARELGESRMILLMDNNLYLMNIVDDNENPSREFKGKLTTLNDDSEGIKISQVFNCEGLLLCLLENDNTKVVVWNPYLGQTKWIETRYSYPLPKMNTLRYGLKYAIGYENKKNKSYRSHKILRFICDPSLNKTGRKFIQCEIYDFDSDLWMAFDVTPHWRIKPHHHGVSLRGNTYWCCTNIQGYRDYIICFDFTSERFGPRLPLPFRAGRDSRVTLSCVREKKLAALFEALGTYKIEMWITTKIEATKVSWSKFLTVDTGLGYEEQIGSFLIDKEKKAAVVFDKCWFRRVNMARVFGKDGDFRELDLGQPTNNDYLPFVCSFVPSLVQIKET